MDKQNKRRLEPEEVFTPRSHSVNQRMYIHRPRLEDAFKSALRGSYHIIMYGDSGCGKSWLYKSVLQEEKVPMLTANLANAARWDDINNELNNVVGRERIPKVTKINNATQANLGSKYGGVSTTESDEFEVPDKEPFEKCLEHIANAQKRSWLVALREWFTGAKKLNKGCFVFDNMEQILGKPRLVRQLSNLILLADDNRYAQYGVKVVIVGVSSDIRAYFQQIDNFDTVANRIKELPEVSRLEDDQARQLISKGLFEALGLVVNSSILTKDDLLDRIVWMTDRIPQQIHDVCLQIAIRGRAAGGRIDCETLEQAVGEWIESSLNSHFSAAISAMNSRDTKAGRRNQTLYALGKCEKEEFRHGDIEQIVREEFGASTEGVGLNLPQILKGLTESKHPILRKTEKGDEFRFSDPKFRMVLRALLHKTADGKVERAQFEIH